MITKGLLLYCSIFSLLLLGSCANASKDVTQDVPTIRSEHKTLVNNFHKIYKDSLLSAKEQVLLQTIEELKKGVGNDNTIARCYNLLGSSYRRESQYNKSIEAYNKALATDDPIIQIETLNNMGVSYRRQDKLRTAASFHLQALKIIEEYHGDYATISFQHRVSLNSIGNIYLALKQYPKALEYFNQSLDLEIEAQNHLGMAINYNNMGSTYQFLGNYEEAEKNYTRALRENTIINSSLGKSISYNSLGELHLLQGNTKQAMLEFDSALVYSSLLLDNYHKSITHVNLSKAYIELKNFDKAFVQLEILDSLAHNTNSRSVYQSLYAQLSTYYEHQDKPRLALDYYRKAVTYNDSIVNETNSSFINDILSVYETEKKEQQIELLSVQNKINSQRLKLGIAIIVVLLLALTLLYYIEKEKKKQQILDMRIVQQQLLRSQMNPHFLFNALGSIQNFMLKNETKKAAGYLNNFASLTRSILKLSSQDSVLLSEEIEMLRNYIKLEQMRLQHSFEFNIDFDEDLEIDFIHIPPMLIQPFVENAIKHGLKNIERQGQLNITFAEQDNKLNIQVRDNGTGIGNAPQTPSTHRSMSMQIFEKRQKLLWDKEKKRVDFSISDAKKTGWAESGTIVNIHFPIE